MARILWGLVILKVISLASSHLKFDCGEGWKTKFTNCYLFVNKPETRKNAEEVCNWYGSQLANPKDGTELDYLNEVAVNEFQNNTDFWIGYTLNKNGCDGFWENFQPDRSAGKCVAMKTGGLYMVKPCEQYYSYVCQKEACLHSSFQCTNNKCLSTKWLCDGENDCGDGSDERSCSKYCNYYLKGTNGTFTLNPQTCQDNSNALLTLEAPIGSRIKLEFTKMNLTRMIEYIEIWSGSSKLSGCSLIARIVDFKTSDFYSSNNFLFVRFVTHKKVTSVVFSFDWSTIPLVSKVLQANTKPQTLESPLNPILLPNIHLNWKIKATQGNVITIHLTDLDLPINKGASLMIQYGSVVVAKLTKSTKNEVFISNTNEVSLVFQTKNEIGKGGFNLQFHEGCQVNLEAEYGVISSPGFNYEDPNTSTFLTNMECTWNITSPVGQRSINIVFNWFKLTDSKDTVKILAGSKTLNVQNSLVDSVQTVQSPMRLEFISSVVDGPSGFRAAFSISCPDIKGLVSNLTEVNRTSGIENAAQSVVELSCSKGYTFQQEEYNKMKKINLTCNMGGKWSNSLYPSCELIYCGMFPYLSNGRIENATGVTYLSRVYYTCNNGFSMAKSQSYIECLENGQWSSLPNCKGLECGNLTTKPNSVIEQVSGDNNEVDAIKMPRCNDGYNLIGEKRFICLSNQTWSSNEYTCEPKSCLIPFDSKAKVSEMMMADGKSFNYSCIDGYHLDGMTTKVVELSCSQGNLTVNGSLFNEKMKCIDIDECQNKICGANICHNTEGSFECKCHEGYELDGKTACKDIDECKDGQNGGCHHKCMNLVGGYKCSCHDGYELFIKDGQNNISLANNENGTRINDVLRLNHSCIKIMCPALRSIENGRLMTNEKLFYYNNTASYTCNTGYILNGDKEIMCKSNGNWSAPPPICKEATCPNLNLTAWKIKPSNVSLNVNLPVPFGDRINAICILPNNQTIIRTYLCIYENSEYKLKGDVFDCPEIDCGFPDYDGHRADLVTSTTYQSSFIFKCNDNLNVTGKSLDNNKNVTCQVNGLWSYGSLQCQGGMCSDPGSPNDGYQVGNSYLAGVELNFNCTRAGYSPSPSTPLICNGTHWNGTVPECKDSESPTFLNCPKGYLDFFYLKPIVIPSLDVTDNVGVKSITSIPYKVNGTAMPDKNQTVIFTAEDYEGNSKKCQFEIHVIFEEPDYLSCPNEISVDVTAMNNTVQFDKFVNSSDDQNLQVFPSNLIVTPQMAGTYHQVKAKLNEYMCYFMVKFEATECLQTSLRTPANSKQICTKGSNSIYCTLTCHDGFKFPDDSTTMTTNCSKADIWTPSNIPDCIETTLANYSMSFDLIYETFDTGVDLEKEVLNVKSILERICTGVTFTNTLKSSSSPAVMLQIKYVFRMTSKDLSLKNNLNSCRSKVLKYGIKNATKLITPNFKSVKYIGTENCTQNAECPETFISIVSADKNLICEQCPSGTYINNNNNCLPCPIGKYRPIYKQGKCIECPNGTTTHSTGSESKDKCLRYCPPGYTSQNGLPPCTPCPVDSFSVNSTQCKNCENSSTTLRKTGAFKCFEQCPKGYFSLSGFYPCTKCPMHFYQNASGSTKCQECSSTHFTITTGATECNSTSKYTIENHQVKDTSTSKNIDPCIGNPCYNEATCITIGSNYNCSCRQSSNCTFEFVGAKLAKDLIIRLKNIEKKECENKCRANIKCKIFLYLTSKDCLLFNGSISADASGFETYRKKCIYTELYSGTRCENKISPFCTPNICGSEGKCQEMPDGYNCLCKFGYSGKPCKPIVNPCANVNCSGHGKPLKFNTRCDCECDWGFRGKNCEVKDDKCLGDPCLFGGKCTDGNHTFTCNCQNGHSGSNCEILPNYCQNEPCSNASSNFCYNDYDKANYTCYCNPPYKTSVSGDCELIDYCENTPCENNGTCSTRPMGQFHCSCPTGFTGSKCQHNIDDCVTLPCKNGGKCIDLVENYKCECLPGFEGPTCSIKEDSCYQGGVLRYCNQTNTLNCTNLPGNNYECHCSEGYEGKNCTSNINECKFHPCEHGGICQDTEGSFNCACKDGWTGKTCEKTQDFCRADTCQNDAKCFNLPYDFYCRCSNKSSGKNCSKVQNKCNLANICINGGICIEKSGCRCPANYTGVSCQLEIDRCQQQPCGANEICKNVNGEHICHKSKDDSSSSCLSIPCAKMENVLNCSGNASDCKNLTEDFDIVFDSKVSTKGATLSHYVQFSKNDFSFCLNILFSNPLDLKGKFITLLKQDKNKASEEYLVISTKGIHLNSTFQAYTTEFNFKGWSYFCLSITSAGVAEVLVNEIERDTLNLPKLELDNAMFSVVIGRDFYGYITALKIFNRILSFDQFINLPANPLIKWAGYYPSIGARIQIPSCRQSISKCISKSDKVPPKFTNCKTGDINIICPKGTCSYNISHLTTNKGHVISSIKEQGDVYTWGSKDVIFISKDKLGNSAYCRSKLNVQYKACDYPANVNKTTCNIMCPSGQALCLPFPRKISCSKLGVFNRKDPLNSLPIPPCGDEEAFMVRIKMNFKFAFRSSKVNCTEASAKDKFTILVKEITNKAFNKYQDICINSCQNINYKVECTDNSRVFTTEIVLTDIPMSITKIDNSTVHAVKEMEKLLIEEKIYNDLSKKNLGDVMQKKSSVSSVPICKTGFGIVGDKCVQCGPGTYFNEKTITCHFCPLGSYQNKSGEKYCEECPNNQTTENIGMKKADHCYENCLSGSFFDSGTGKCTPCEKGFYQEEPGKLFCLPCPLGKNTYVDGVNSSSLCFDVCQLGNQLTVNGTCEPCPRGTYRQYKNESSCNKCDNSTTANVGSDSPDDCNVPDCSEGEYLNGTVCKECPFGTYQDKQWQEHCISCPPNQSTLKTGSRSLSSCELFCDSGSERINMTVNCTLCEKGFYRVLNTSNPFTRCSQCPENFTTLVEGASSCKIVICPAGMYRDNTTNTCKDCLQGYYQPNKSTGDCLECPMNYTTLKSGSKEKSDCKFYCKSAGYEIAPSKTDCVACAKGFYKTDKADILEKCSPCPQNFTTTVNEGATNKSQCDLRDCPEGTFINGDVCTLCQNGTYQSERSKDKCEACRNNTFTLREGATDVKECQLSCPAGAEGQQQCETCKDAYFKAVAGPMLCTKCPMHYLADQTRTICNILHCKEGYYNSSESSCEPCAKGQYKNESGNFGCSSCPDSFTTAGNATVNVSQCNIVNCQAGYEFDNTTDKCIACPIGRYQEKIGDYSCLDCPKHFQTAKKGSTNAADCSVLHCTKGHYNASATSCEPCAKGTFKSQPGNTECESCPNSAYTTAIMGSTTPNDCTVVNCQAGYEFDNATDKCIACPIGRYQEKIGDHPCMECPKHFQTAKKGSTNVSDCSVLHCTKGHYNASATSCEPCAKGTFKSQPGNTECESCPNSAYTTAIMGSTTSNDCTVVNCQAGYEFDNTTDKCIACPIGRYQEKIGDHPCMECPKHFQTAKKGSTNVSDCSVLHCTKGHYNASATSCEPCAKGTFKSQPGNTECKNCPNSAYTTAIMGSTTPNDCTVVNCQAGYEFDNTTDKCIACPIGRYQEKIGDHSCMDCPKHFQTAKNGSSNAADCSVLHCTKGHYNASATSCEPCAKGTFKSQPGNTECKSCPNSAYTTAIMGSTTSNDCTVVNCKPGNEFDNDKNECIACPIGTYQPNTGNVSCIPCQKDMETSRNASTSQSDCLLPICPVGQAPTVNFKSCEPCDFNYYKPTKGSQFCIRCKDNKITLKNGSSLESDCVNSTVPVKNTLSTVAVNVQLNYQFTDCEAKKDIYKEDIRKILKKRVNMLSEKWLICKGECKISVTIKCKGSNRRKRAITDDKAEAQVENVRVDSVLKENSQLIKSENVFSKDCHANSKEYQVSSGITPTCSVAVVCLYSLLSSGKCEKCPAGTQATKTGCDACPPGTYSGENQRNCTACPSPLGSKANSKFLSDCQPKCIIFPSYCKNGGNCTKKPNDIYEYCICPLKYSGEQCELYSVPEDPKLNMIYLVIGCIAAVLFIILIIVGIVVHLRHKRAKKQKGYKQFAEGEYPTFNMPIAYAPTLDASQLQSTIL